MSPTKAALVGIAAFVVGMLLVILVFATADVAPALVVGPGIILALSAYGAYRTALTEPRHRSRVGARLSRSS